MKAKKISKKSVKSVTEKPLLGFIGQGFVGKAYADDFERRGFTVVRYALEEPYRANKEKIKECDIVFIAVPTPTTPQGFDDRIVRAVMRLVRKRATAVIKSSVLPGRTELIQKENPDIFVFHSPEFLTARQAAYDVAHPDRNIIGLPKDTPEYRRRADELMKILVKAPYELVCGAREAELIKYGGNNWFYFKVVFINLLYDLALKYGAAFDVIRDGMAADSRIGRTHLDPIHENGRGAGGYCFIKDFAAFADLYREAVGDDFGLKVLESLRDKNNDLLLTSGKDLDLLFGVYGEEALKKHKKSRP